MLGLGLNALGGMEALGMAAAGAAVGFVVLEGFRRLMGRLATMEVMGMGDSKLLMMCGAFLGPTLVLWSLLPGVVIGLIFGTIYTKLAKSPHFPFGPSLGLGALVTALFPKAVSEGVMAFPEKMQTMGTGARMTILLGSIIALVLLIAVSSRSRCKRWTSSDDKLPIATPNIPVVAAITPTRSVSLMKLSPQGPRVVSVRNTITSPEYIHR